MSSNIVKRSALMSSFGGNEEFKWKTGKRPAEKKNLPNLFSRTEFRSFREDQTENYLSIMTT